MASTHPPADEEALVASALAGDLTALSQLLATHQHSAYNVAFRLLGNEADARDAVQEAFVLTLRAVRGEAAPPRDLERFGPWLRRVVVRAALGHLRRRPAFRDVPVDEIGDHRPSAGYDDPARVAERREVRGDVLRAFLALPDVQRAALTLREYEGLSYDEIAASLEVSHAAVERLLFRARRGFRDAYEGLTGSEQSVGCPEFASLVEAWLDDESSTPASPELTAHLATCRNCRRELTSLRSARRLVALVPLLATPTDWNPIASTVPEAAAHGIQAALEASLAGSGPAPVPGTAAPPSVVGLSGAAGAPAAPAAGGGMLATVAGFTGAKAAAVLITAGIVAAAVAAPHVPSIIDPMASSAAVTPLASAAASPPVVVSPVAVSPVASPSATTTTLLGAESTTIPTSEAATAVPAASTGTPPAVSTATP
jgi:RNA polymerase sigma-70 factor, ECF subfamily